jgi:DegV family protein with EDD domain
LKIEGILCYSIRAFTLKIQKELYKMSKIQIMTDSASDISVADEKEHSIAIIPFPIVLGGKSYTSRVDFDNDQFYAMMAANDGIPMTSQITPFQFMDIYLEQAKAGVNDLILVLINSKGSSTYNNSVQAIELFQEEHPEFTDFRVHSFDGIGYNASYGKPVVEAAKMNENGASAEEICAYLKDVLPRRELFFGIYDLKYAAKSGRIPTAAAFLGNTLNLKPVMKIFDNEITTAVKCRGEKNLVKKVAELSLADMEPGSPYELVYGCDAQCLEEIRTAMVQALGYEPDGEYQIGAAVAANAGPKVVGVAFTKK